MGRGILKEGHHASTTNQLCAPPRPSRPQPPSQVSQLWLALPADNRQQILKALSRVVIEHLTLAAAPREVTHEQP